MDPKVLFIGLFFTFLGWWQLDHMMSNILWKLRDAHIEIARFPFLGIISLDRKNFYTLCYLSMALGLTIMILFGEI